MTRTRARRRRWLRVGFGLAFSAVLVEAGAYAAGRVLQRKWAMYVDPTRTYEGRIVRDYDHYLQLRDPDLGWPYPQEIGGANYDVDGSIRLPANAAFPGEPPAVSLYGDSYVRALSNVTPAESWPNHLALALDRPVKNFGVSGYGSDQAFLRFRRNVDDRAPVVVLGHMAENMTRNLTRLRDLTGVGGQGFSFKPRFVIGDDGQLELVPLARLEPSEYRRLVGLESPQFWLEHEHFQVGGPTGAVRLELPFSASLVRNLGYWRLRARVFRYPEYAPFYEPDHPLQGHAVTLGILRAFAREARARGSRPIVLLFPGPNDAADAQRTGVHLFAHLVAALRDDGIEVVDFTPILLAYLGPRDPAEAYLEHHFTGEIEPLVAAAVRDQILAAPLAVAQAMVPRSR